MALYQLGQYNHKTDLSEQGTIIRDFVVKTYDYNSVKKLVEQFDSLEEESISILRDAILAGNWTSYYGFNWKADQEIEFWEMVYSKNPNSGIAILTLAESYRGNGIKELEEVMDLYFKAIAINLMHFFSLTQDDGGEELDTLRNDVVLNKKLLSVEIDIMSDLYNSSREEILEEKPRLLKKCNGNKELEEYVLMRINALIESK